MSSTSFRCKWDHPVLLKSVSVQSAHQKVPPHSQCESWKRRRELFVLTVCRWGLASVQRPFPRLISTWAQDRGLSSTVFGEDYQHEAQAGGLPLHSLWHFCNAEPAVFTWPDKGQDHCHPSPALIVLHTFLDRISTISHGCQKMLIFRALFCSLKESIHPNVTA